MNAPTHDSNQEGNGEKFNLGTYFEARRICQAVTEEIIQQVVPGMTESEGQSLIQSLFKAQGISKFWHPSKFRLGPDTTKTFRALPDPGIVAQAGDMCFVDVGPIINDHEADFGRSFIIGGKPTLPAYQSLIDDCEQIFFETAAAWKTQNLSGLELFRFAEDLAQKRGCNLNPLMAGHRLGDFPHHIHSKKNLFEWEQVPTENLWVLEIHVCHDDLGRGAFYEDILSRS